MVIVKVYGGLGNQLFQYANARALAKKRGTQLIIDSSWFVNTPNNSTKRELGLTKLGLDIKTAGPIKTTLLRLGNSLDRSIIKNPVIKYAREASGVSLDQLTNSKNPVLYLDGYWQQYKNIEPIRLGLAKEIESAVVKSDVDQGIIKLLKTNSSVAVHARRGDYVTSQKNQSIYNQLGKEYYNTAIKYIEERIDSPMYFIFSDDVQWAKENIIPNGNAVYVSDVSKGDEISDFLLMSKCKNFITANSTYSWWAAYIGSAKSNGIVVSPKYWLRSKPAINKELLPEGWQLFD